MGIVIIFIFIILAITAIICYTSYNHRKQEEAFWGDKTKKQVTSNNCDIDNIYDELNSVSQSIHQMSAQIKELYSGMQTHYERLTAIESKLQISEAKKHSKEKTIK